MNTSAYLIEAIDLESVIGKTLMNHLFEGICVVDNNKNIKYWNRGAENITGYKSEELIHQFCDDTIVCYKNENSQTLNELTCPLSKVIENPCFIDERNYILHKNGHKIPVRIQVIPIINSEGEVIGAIEFFIDDSDYENLKQVNKKLEELNEMKNQFLGMAAHDLRNPLSLVTGFCSYILEFGSTNLTLNQKSMIEKILSAGKRMITMLNTLLDITAIESGKVVLNKKRTNIKDLLREENYSMKLLAAQKNIDLKFDLSEDIPEIEVDSERVIQVIENLISNAIKFSYPQTMITVKAGIENEQVYISVKDQGIGITEKDMPKLFKPFEKTSSKPTGKEKSSGLGLVIVKKLVELHNGNIKVSSKPDKGSEFTILLPAS
jgi:PAS domain S-box-containing protein